MYPSIPKASLSDYVGITIGVLGPEFTGLDGITAVMAPSKPQKALGISADYIQAETLRVFQVRDLRTRAGDLG